jgi:hypothetical protein
MDKRKNRVVTEVKRTSLKVIIIVVLLVLITRH